MSLEYARNRLENSEKRIQTFIDENIVDWSIENILQPTQKIALEFGLNQNALNGMEIVKDGFMKAKMIWEYRGPDDVPLHIFLEKGFKPHNIEAIGKLLGGADFLKWKDKTGKNIFRKKVRHPGFEGYHILEKGWTENRDSLKSRIVLEVNNFLQVNRL